MTIFTADLYRVCDLSMNKPIAMTILAKVAVHTLHALLGMN